MHDKTATPFAPTSAITSNLFDLDLTPPQHGLNLSPIMNVALLAASAAGTEIRRGWRQRHVIEEKGVGDLVSAIDRKADEAACSLLRIKTPEIPILSEELNPEVKALGGKRWIVDPLDATSAFLFEAGPHYPSAMVALHDGQQTLAGVVLFPLTGEWFYAQRGCGAFKNGIPLRVGEDPVPLSEAWVDLNQYGNSAFETPQFSRLREALRSPSGARMVTSDVPHSGIALRIIEGSKRLSAAVHDNSPSKPKQAPWDLAAPQVIVEEAGGVFLNSKKQPVDIFKTELVFISQSRPLAEAIIDLLG
jgi:myo-inositol-1(or 4)-monophosphatase